MSYCSSCGAYMPDWAEECPACGKARTEPKKRAQTRKKPSAQAGSAAAKAEAGTENKAGAKTSGEYHYSYKKPAGGGTRSGGARPSAGKGAFTYEEGGSRAGGGSFSYDEEKQRRDTAYYAREYKSDAADNKWLAALCYLGPMFLLSWLLKPNSKFVRYHANQGLVLFLCSIVINIFDFIPFMWVVNIFSVVCFFIGVFNALGGKRKPLPIIGDITLIK